MLRRTWMYDDASLCRVQTTGAATIAAAMTGAATTAAGTESSRAAMHPLFAPYSHLHNSRRHEPPAPSAFSKFICTNRAVVNPAHVGELARQPFTSSVEKMTSAIAWDFGPLFSAPQT